MPKKIHKISFQSLFTKQSNSWKFKRLSVCSCHRAHPDPPVYRGHSALQDPEATRYRTSRYQTSYRCWNFEFHVENGTVKLHGNCFPVLFFRVVQVLPVLPDQRWVQTLTSLKRDGFFDPTRWWHFCSMWILINFSETESIWLVVWYFSALSSRETWDWTSKDPKERRYLLFTSETFVVITLCSIYLKPLI